MIEYISKADAAEVLRRGRRDMLDLLAEGDMSPENVHRAFNALLASIGATEGLALLSDAGPSGRPGVTAA